MTENNQNNGLDYSCKEPVECDPFGMPMPGRNYTSGEGYRFGFNGKETDKEYGAGGGTQDYGFRMYSPAVGKFLSKDPLFKSYPWYTPYQFAGNKPINSIDLDGLEELRSIENMIEYNNAKALVGETATDEQILTAMQMQNAGAQASVESFKAGFNHYLPKKLIDHYAYGFGADYELSAQEMKDIRPRAFGIFDSYSNTDRARDGFYEYNSLRGSDGEYLQPGATTHFSRKFEGGQLVSGTLGQYTITIEGTITMLDPYEGDSHPWKFEGTMEFSDVFDFDPHPENMNSRRTDEAEQLVRFANIFLPGMRFNVSSEKVNVTQYSYSYNENSKKKALEYFNDVETTPVPNNVGKAEYKKEQLEEKMGND